MFMSKKKIKAFEERLYQAEEESAKLKRKVFSLEEKLAKHELYTAKELSEVYKKLVEVQKEISRKITDDCEKQNILAMIKELKEKLDFSVEKIYGDMLALRGARGEEDEDGASIMDEYLNGGREDE